MNIILYFPRTMMVFGIVLIALGAILYLFDVIGIRRYLLGNLPEKRGGATITALLLIALSVILTFVINQIWTS